jgi:phenylacetate-CoA ligase
VDLGNVVRAVKLDKAAQKREGWSRDQLLAYQRERIEAIERHAVAHCALYRERGVDQPLDKATLMARYEDVVTDPRLRREDLLAHVESVDHDARLFGGMRVMSTSGSSGLKGLFAYDRDGWAAVSAGFMRVSRWAQTTPRLPRRKVGYVGPSGGMHMSRRLASSIGDGPHRMRVFPATLPLAQIARGLDAWQPEMLGGYPSMLAALAEEQTAGRLHIAPRRVMTSSELRTPAMTAAIERAWGSVPWDMYALTEAGILGAECEHHQGIHVFEDFLAVEVVDADGRRVPDGEVGHQMLVTSLDNRLQPTIRLAVSDMVALDSSPCPCGRPFARLRAIEGRTEDVLIVDGVLVHPLQFASFAVAPEVREFQVVQHGSRLTVRTALRDGADAQVVAPRLEAELTEKLRRLGLESPHVRVETCDAIARDPARMGKLKLIVAG